MAFPDAVDDARRILVVDDSRAQRRLLSKTLSKWGYGVVEAGSGEEALEICASVDVELVVSDWLMPGMTGLEFCRLFRRLKDHRPAYFILLTAQTERERLAEGLENGADDFLSKPFNVTELRARIRAGVRVVDAQRDMIAKNRLLRRALDDLEAAQSAIERDLKEARNFQQALVPERFIALPGAEVSMLYQPSGHVGGDLVGMFQVSEARYGIYSIDVAGHGIASALMTARVAANLSASSPEHNVALVPSAHGGFEMASPSQVCRRLNHLLVNEFEMDKYLTMLIAEVDVETGSVVFAQAGHPSPLLQRRGGEVEFLSSAGLPVGLFEDADYEDQHLQTDSGDRLIFYSDGITECPDPSGQLLDEAGFRDMVVEQGAASGLEFVNGLTTALERHSGRSDFPDDLSAIIFHRL